MSRLKRHWWKVLSGLGTGAFIITIGLLTGSQLGSNNPPSTPTPTPLPLSASAIDLGGHSCAVGTGAGLYCWGPNDQGQLGSSTSMCTTVPCSTVPLNVPGVANVAQVSVGDAHTCVVTTSGAAYCWGDNASGQLGNGTTTDSMSPVQPTGLGSGVKEISAGGQHTCAILTSEVVKCWGANAKGQVGDGTYTTPRTSPVTVTIPGTGQTRLSIAAGRLHTCVISSADVWCWGDNASGQLGAGQFCPQICDSNVPKKINPNSFGDWVFAVWTGSDHNCALIGGGHIIKCWGENSLGQLGINDTSDRSLPFQVYGSGSGVQEVSPGRNHTCARVATHVECWGDNSAGQLGDGSTAQHLTPTQIPSINNVENVGAGIQHSCLLTDTNTVMCWGTNLDGQVGDGTSTPSSTSPVAVAPPAP